MNVTKAVHQSIFLTSEEQCEFFRGIIFQKDGKLCWFLCVVEPFYRNFMTKSENVPIVKVFVVFAVFSFQDDTSETKSSVVFPTVVKRVQYTLQYSPMLFDENKVSPGFWTVLRQDEVATSLWTDTEQKFFWFIGDPV